MAHGHAKSLPHCFDLTIPKVIDRLAIALRAGVPLCIKAAGVDDRTLSVVLNAARDSNNIGPQACPAPIIAALVEAGIGNLLNPAIVRLALAYDHQRDVSHARQKQQKRAAPTSSVASARLVEPKKRKLPTFLQRLPSSGGGDGGGIGGGGMTGSALSGGKKDSGPGKRLNRRKSGGKL